jgi:hypothetical protein
MPVYVDSAKNRFRGMIMCHMLADSLAELHGMAERLGLKREWFQSHGTPHYDICSAKKRLAIQNGAIEISRRQVVKLIRAWRTCPNLPSKIEFGDPISSDSKIPLEKQAFALKD